MNEYKILIGKFLDKTISKDERTVLKDWIRKSDNNMIFFKTQIKNSDKKVSIDFDSDTAYQKFSAFIKSKRRERLIPNSIFKYAAILIACLSIGFLTKEILINRQANNAAVVVSGQDKKMDKNNVIITLSDGSKKVFYTNDEDVITDKKGNVIANKKANSLTFGSDIASSNNAFNEIFIPFGQTFKLKLSDGTLVWLNAGSKLRFPQKFVDTDKERIVYLDGEAYFEVTKNKVQPFIVSTQQINIKVLGTKFNISSYESDNFIATTLVEGSVNVYETNTPKNIVQLTPSFQANYDKLENNFSKSKVDTSIYTAWMQNKLVIDNLKFSEILVKLERRFNVKFINKTKNLNDDTYKGEFENEDIESILKTISLSTPFKYEINQNEITITK